MWVALAHSFLLFPETASQILNGTRNSRLVNKRLIRAVPRVAAGQESIPIFVGKPTLPINGVK